MRLTLAKRHGRDSVPGARKGFPAVFRAALVQTFAALVLSTPLRSVPRMGDTPPLALAAPAGVGLGQGVFVEQTQHSHSKTEARQNAKPIPNHPFRDVEEAGPQL